MKSDQETRLECLKIAASTLVSGGQRPSADTVVKTAIRLYEWVISKGYDIEYSQEEMMRSSESPPPRPHPSVPFNKG